MSTGTVAVKRQRAAIRGLKKAPLAELDPLRILRAGQRRQTQPNAANRRRSEAHCISRSGESADFLGSALR
jgi:hypothetical protein